VLGPLDSHRAAHPIDASVDLRDFGAAMRPPDRPVPLRAVRIQAQCPVCGKPADGKHRPFCSKRCADIDLGRWLKESYRVPAEESPDEGDEPPRGPTGQER
jgi:uncharacterized protein